MWIAVPDIGTTLKLTMEAHVFMMKEKKRLFHSVPGSRQNIFSLTLRELCWINFCLKVLLICICVYLLTKITLRDIWYELIT